MSHFASDVPAGFRSAETSLLYALASTAMPGLCSDFRPCQATAELISVMSHFGRERKSESSISSIFDVRFTPGSGRSQIKSPGISEERCTNGQF